MTRREFRRPGAVAWIAVGVSLALCWHYIVLAADAYLLDLDVYREAVDAAWSGADIYAARFTDVELPYLYPPFAILFLSPVALLSQVSAQVVWTVVTLLAVMVYAVVCVENFAAPRFHTPTVIAVTVAFTLAMEPTESGFKFGQVNMLLAAFVVLDLSRRTGRLPQGVLTGLAAAVKLTPLMLVLYYLVTGRVRSAAITTGVFAACTAVAAVVFPEPSMRYWGGMFASSDRVGVSYISNQSINGMLQRLLGDTVTSQAAWLALASAVTVATLVVARHLYPTYPHLTDALVLAAILLVSPISWTAHWILILPLLLVAAFPERPVPLLQALAALLASAMLYGVVRPRETAQILVEPQESEFWFGNSFTWLTLVVATACVAWYWSRVRRDSKAPGAPAGVGADPLRIPEGGGKPVR